MAQSLINGTRCSEALLAPAAPSRQTAELNNAGLTCQMQTTCNLYLQTCLGPTIRTKFMPLQRGGLAKEPLRKVFDQIDNVMTLIKFRA